MVGSGCNRGILTDGQYWTFVAKKGDVYKTTERDLLIPKLWAHKFDTISADALGAVGRAATFIEEAANEAAKEAVRRGQ